MDKENNAVSCCSNSYKCSVALALDVIGGKWKPLILWHLKDGVLRFGELRRILVGISQKMLTSQLRELELDGLVYRHIYTQVPPKVEYSLTEKGQSVIPILEMISKWGSRNCK
jgi:DNA-binding HxlR family transcriptional regulator